MANNIWDEFDKNLDVKGMQEDIKQAQENTFERKEVPLGQYEIAINKLELTTSKNGDPMFSAWMKILSEGEYKGQMLFMNQVVTLGFQIHNVNEFLRSLDTGIEIVFEKYGQYAKLIEEVKKAIDDSKLEYGIEYGENKGFKTFKITDVFEPEK